MLDSLPLASSHLNSSSQKTQDPPRTRDLHETFRRAYCKVTVYLGTTYLPSQVGTSLVHICSLYWRRATPASDAEFQHKHLKSAQLIDHHSGTPRLWSNHGLLLAEGEWSASKADHLLGDLPYRQGVSCPRLGRTCWRRQLGGSPGMDIRSYSLMD